MSKHEKMLDKKMNVFLEKGLVKKIVKNDLIKQMLSTEFMENVSNFINSSWEIIMKILGILAIIFGILGFITLLGASGLGVLLSGGFSIIFIFSLALGLLSTIIIAISGWGMLKMKKWFPFVYTISFFLALLDMIVKLMSGSMALGSAVIGLLIGMFFWFIVLKKRKTFTK